MNLTVRQVPVWRTVVSAIMALSGLAACGDGAASVTETRQPPPVTKVEIIATDFAFEIEPRSLSEGVIETVLVNEGKEPHQAGYYLLNEGVSYEDFVSAILEDDSMIPQLAEGGRAGHMRSLSGGETGVRPGDELEAGEYAVVCSIRDPKTGKNHYELGMTAPLTVEGNS